MNSPWLATGYFECPFLRQPNLVLSARVIRTTVKPANGRVVIMSAGINNTVMFYISGQMRVIMRLWTSNRAFVDTG